MESCNGNSLPNYSDIFDVIKIRAVLRHNFFDDAVQGLGVYIRATLLKQAYLLL